MRTRRGVKRIAAIAVIFAVTFTMIPMATGTLDSHAATAKAPAQVTGFTAKATNYKTVRLSWKKIPKNKNTQGYAIYRNGKLLKRVGKNTNAFNVTPLNGRTKYYFKVAAYNTYKYTQYYNTKTKKWQNKKPAKNYWKGKKTRKVTGYKYGKASVQRAVTTPAASVAPTPAPADKDAVFTGASLTGQTNAVANGSRYEYKTSSSGNVTWTVSDATIATIAATGKSANTCTCSLTFKKAGTVKLTAKSALNGKTKNISISVKADTDSAFAASILTGKTLYMNGSFLFSSE